MAYSMSVWNHRGPLDRLSGCQRTQGSWGFFIPTAFLKAGEPREFFGLAHMNDHRTAVLTHYYALESASAGRGCHKTAFFHHSTPRCALINLVTWIYNFNQEIKSDQHWALWNKGHHICTACAQTFSLFLCGGDNEKYEDDFSIAEYSTVACGRMFGAGMCFANLNVERVFLYFHYEYVKCEFG